MSTSVNKSMEAEITVKIDGKQRKVTKLELGFIQLANKASRGDLKAIEKATVLYERHCPPRNDDPIPEEEAAYDLETLGHYFEMRRGAEDEDDE